MSPLVMIEAASAMAYVMVDVESDGPIPGDYSMICVGAVLVQEGLQETFYGRLRPIGTMDPGSPCRLRLLTR
jgi:hypothetical protein